MNTGLSDKMEDHALESVPEAARKGWLQISWNTAGLVTTLVMLFFGALVCFVAGVKIALMAGLSAFIIGNVIAWLIARVTYATGFSNTLITRKYGLGVRGSVLASLIFGFLIIGFLALENALLYRGVIFFFDMDNNLFNQIFIYGLFTISWILLTAFGFDLVSRVSSVMLVGFLVVLFWVIIDIVSGAERSVSELVLFESQFPPDLLTRMGVRSDLDKFVFGLNILVGPACALALNTADFGRYGKSPTHIGIAASVGIGFQSLIMMIVGGVLMFAGSDIMLEHYATVQGMSAQEAPRQVLKNPDSIAATFMVFAGATGFILMFLAQAKAQVLNAYSSSLCLSNMSDALLGWRPGRLTFVVLANVIALLMLYGHILELVEQWIKLLGVLLSALSSVIIMDYFVVAKRVGESDQVEQINWAGVISLVTAVVLAHWVLKPWQPIEVLSSIATVAVLYPVLRLWLLRPRG
ncbi:MAG: cytosine permease [Candidatus Thiodiazotropha sp. (ex. Lucinoma kazani)]